MSPPEKYERDHATMHDAPAGACEICDKVRDWTARARMVVWRSRSGRLHLRRRCTGAGPAFYMDRMRITLAMFDQAERCPCLRSFSPEVRKEAQR